MGQTCSAAGHSQTTEGTVDLSRNGAIVFIKPHAVKPAVETLVLQTLKARGIDVLSSGRIDAATIDQRGLIDTHYGAIAARALHVKPCDLVVQPGPKADFEKLFGITWEDALGKGLVFNARDAAAKLGMESLKLSEESGKTKRGVDQLKFGGGFYVARIQDIFVVNGFYEGMRAKFTAEGTCIKYFAVEWDAASLPWEKFRGEFIGATNPKEATTGSIRSTIFQQWESLGLAAEPDTGDNAVHASASPFEGLAEKANWLSASIEEDAMGRALLQAGLSQDTIKEWMQDPAVSFQGKRQSLFDHLEDLDSESCVRRAAAIRARQVNSAFLFVKPHAVNDAVCELVRKMLAERGVRVVRSGRIGGETIDAKGLIDTHYGAIAARALRVKPYDLVVQPGPKADFEKLFGITWEDALGKGLVFNARDAAAKLGMEPLQLSEESGKTKRGVDQLKFGGGFYVARIQDIYVINGFYEGMRAKFTTPGQCIDFCQVEWDAALLPWEKFRGELIGATNPKEAAAGSIRNTIFHRWESLGLAAEPDTGDNAVHASASPFEGLAENANWLSLDTATDPLGQELSAAGLSQEMIAEWMQDPAVVFEGKRQSLFDLLEDLNADDCLQRAADICRQQATHAKVPSMGGS